MAKVTKAEDTKQVLYIYIYDYTWLYGLNLYIYYIYYIYTRFFNTEKERKTLQLIIQVSISVHELSTWGMDFYVSTLRNIQIPQL